MKNSKKSRTEAVEWDTGRKRTRPSSTSASNNNWNYNQPGQPASLGVTSDWRDNAASILSISEFITIVFRHQISEGSGGPESGRINPLQKFIIIWIVSKEALYNTWLIWGLLLYSKYCCFSIPYIYIHWHYLWLFLCRHRVKAPF